MNANNRGLFSTLVVAFLAVLITIGLGELYGFVIESFRLVPWIGVLLSHVALSLVLYAVSVQVRTAMRLRGIGYTPWLPMFLVILITFGLAFSTRSDGPAYTFNGTSEMIYVMATLTVIPVVEEMVFRGGVTPVMARLTSPFWSSWFSALIFSAAHTMPTFSRVLDLKVGVILGPFLLGICCDMIVRRWGRLWPAIAFHSACNASVYIFSIFNPSWLTRLSGLYV